MRSRADIVFGPTRVAVFVDGCFWHGCPDHATTPKNNEQWWRDKIEANRRRDERVVAELEAAEWTAIRIWEHDDVEAAAARIAVLIEKRRHLLD